MAENTVQSTTSVFVSTSQGSREYQEDACGHWFDGEGDRLFAVVADGAGGHGGGAEAAQAAIGSASEAWKAGLQGEDAAGSLDVWMAQAHRSVNEASAKINKSALFSKNPQISTPNSERTRPEQW